MERHARAGCGLQGEQTVKVLFIEESADGLLDLAIRAKDAGHDVRYHVSSFDNYKHPTGRGLVERVADWRAAPNWPDLVVVGGNGKWLRELDAWRIHRGVPMIGGNYAASQLELDRLAGMAAFKKARIEVPPFRQCASLDDAEAYVADRGEGFAIKPCGSVADKALSFVAKNKDPEKAAAEAIWRLRQWKRAGKRFPAGLMVQERIKGVEFAVGCWIGPNGFVDGVEENVETKKLFPGDLGPNTGEMGTIMRLVRKSKLFDKVLRPMEDMLVGLGFVGNVDINTIIAEDGTPYPLEWTVRCGWPSTNIELALHSGDFVEYLAGVAAGKPPSTRILDQIAVGVVLAIPPFPHGHEKTEEVVNVPVWGVVPSIEDNLHFADVMMGNAPSVVEGRIQYGPQLATSGAYVLVGTGTGSTVVEARNEAVRVLNRLTVAQPSFYRNDIGARLRTGLTALHANGYALGARYA
jgi:phosphoribosylamine--glycine ligase